MATFTTVKLIGSGQTYTTFAAWETDAPANLTTAKQFNASTFSGAFTQAESLSFSPSGATGKFLDSDGSTYLSFGVVTGTPATGDTVTGGSSGKTCVISDASPRTGCVWQGQINAASDLFSSGSNLLTVSGSTSSSTAYKELTTKTGASFRDNANVQTNALRYNASNGAAITYSGTAIAIDVQEWFRMSNLQVAGTASGGIPFSSDGSLGGNATVDFCIFEGKNAAAGGANSAFSMYGANNKVRNSLIVQRLGSATRIARIAYSAGAYNCTFAVPSNLTAATDAITGNYATNTIENCAIFGAANTFSGSSTFSATTCFGDDATPPTGVTTLTYDTSTGSGFQNITDGTHDYRVKSGSGLLDVGTTDSTNAATDIAGTSRPQGSAYDVGCWELVPAAGGSTRHLFIASSLNGLGAGGAYFHNRLG